MWDSSYSFFYVVAQRMIVDTSSLFQARDFDDEIFYFDNIIVRPSVAHLDRMISIVEFHYSFCEDIRFHSSISIDGFLNTDNFSTIFAIGMYWE